MSIINLPRSPQDFPDALQGGEGLESPDHRIGERTGHGPSIDQVEPDEPAPPKDETPPADEPAPS